MRKIIILFTLMFLMMFTPFSVQTKQNNWEYVVVTETNNAFMPDLAFGADKFGIV